MIYFPLNVHRQEPLEAYRKLPSGRERVDVELDKGMGKDER